MFLIVFLCFLLFIHNGVLNIEVYKEINRVDVAWSYPDTCPSPNAPVLLTRHFCCGFLMEMQSVCLIASQLWLNHSVKTVKLILIELFYMLAAISCFYLPLLPLPNLADLLHCDWVKP